MRRLVIIIALAGLAGCWDFPAERYDVKDSGRDGVVADQKVNMDRKKVVDVDVAADLALDKAAPLDLPGDQGPTVDLTQDQGPTADLPQDQGPTTDLPLDGPGKDLSPDKTPPPPDQKVLLGLGKPCTAAGQCVSGVCKDKVCCNNACAGPCKRCDQTASMGTCADVANGQDPDNDCPDDTAATCGRDGQCDGKGACRKYAAGTICGAGMCKASDPIKVIPPSVCTKKSSCVNLMTTIGETDCGTYRCNPAGPGCHFPCSSGAQCKPGIQCKAGGKCDGKLRPLGATCKNKNECASGYCKDKVCCDKDCKGKNHTCTQPGAMGRCFNLDSGKK